MASLLCRLPQKQKKRYRANWHWKKCRPTVDEKIEEIYCIEWSLWLVKIVFITYSILLLSIKFYCRFVVQPCLPQLSRFMCMGSPSFLILYSVVFFFSIPHHITPWVPAIAGKAKAGVAHSDCGWTCGCAGKIVRSLENVSCHTWALLRWWFTTKRRYIKHLLPHCGD